MRLLGAFLALALCGRAAVLQGIVLDFESGRPLARTLVQLRSLQSGNGAAPQTLRTESNGTFFIGVTPGVYLLTLDREGFATWRYGAKCWNCGGTPLFLNGEERTALDIRMRRLGAVTGTVLDENQVGIPNIPLIAYSATRPLKAIGKALTDERGVFRFGALTPGSYVVRTVSVQTTDGMSYLSSFYPEGTEMRLARPVPVELERTWPGVDFPAVPGKLYRVQGRVQQPFPGVSNSIELISDSGRDKSSVDGGGNFAFDHVSPGNYELFTDGHYKDVYYAAWQQVTVDHDTDVNALLVQCNGVTLSARQLKLTEIKVTMRRHDLDKDGPELFVKPPAMQEIPPGNWEILVTAADSYVRDVTVSGKRVQARSKDSADGWSMTRIGHFYNPVVINTSTSVGSITGRVVDKPNEPAPYAPVYLETLDLEPPDPALIREARTGPDGSFEFHGLPPAKYRIISTFEVDPGDRVAMEYAHAPEIRLAAGGSALHDLSLYHKP